MSRKWRMRSRFLYSSRNASKSGLGITKYYFIFHSEIVLLSACWLLLSDWFCIEVSAIGNGFATPMRTTPFGAPLSAWTAWSREEFSRLMSLTKSSRSPGIKRPSSWATPPGTKDRITIRVSFGSSGSCGAIQRFSKRNQFGESVFLLDNPKWRSRGRVRLWAIR